MSCIKCQSDRIVEVTGKCNDTFGCNIRDNEYEGYVPTDIGIGGGDYIEFKYCLDCGQIQNQFPIPKCEMEKTISEEDFRFFYEDHFIDNLVVPSQHRRILVRSAKDYGTNFQNFIDKFLAYNSQKNMPSSNKLVGDVSE